MHSFTQQPAYRLPGQRCVNERHNLLQNSIVLVYIVVVKTMTISIITFCGATTLFGAILCSTIHTPKLQDGAVIVWISASPKWTLCNSHESHETCHSVTFFFIIFMDLLIPGFVCHEREIFKDLFVNIPGPKITQ